MTRKVVVVGVSLLSLVACCALAWWQWTRFTEANGTFQNLGYVLQWPLFGVAPAFMFWRWHKLRRAEAAQGGPGQDGSTEWAATASAPRPDPAPEPAPPARRPDPVPDETEEDDELAAYNRYLARLNAEESR